MRQALFLPLYRSGKLKLGEGKLTGSRTHSTPAWPTVALHAPRRNPGARDEPGERRAGQQSVGPQGGHSHSQEERTGAGGLGDRRQCLTGTESQFGKMTSILEMAVVMAVQQCECT